MANLPVLNLANLAGTNGFRIDGVAFADLMIGAPSADPGTPQIVGAGSTYVLFGRAAGWGATVALSSLDGTTGFRLDGVAASDNSGYSMASAGDMNGDGFADLVIGAPFAQSSTGSTVIVFGKASGWSPVTAPPPGCSPLPS